MKFSLVFLSLALALSLVSAAQAEKLYKWKNKDGTVSYQDRPPPPEAGTVEEKNISSGPERSSTPANSSEAARKFPVVLYSTPGCGPCDQARAYLKKRGIPFTDKNVVHDPALQKEMKEKVGELSVPTITVGAKVMRGFMESLLEGELDQAGYPKQGKPAEGGEEGSEPPAAEEGTGPAQ